MKQRRRAEIIVIISCIIFVFGHLNCSAHGSGNVHVAEMYSVLPLKPLPNGAATTENQPVTEWLGMITSDLIDNYWGKECPEFNNKCFYDYLRDEFGFRCKHRLLFHWGFNARPWTDELEKKIQDFKTDNFILKQEVDILKERFENSLKSNGKLVEEVDQLKKENSKFAKENDSLKIYLEYLRYLKAIFKKQYLKLNI